VIVTNPDGRTKLRTFAARFNRSPIEARSCVTGGAPGPCVESCPPAGPAPADVCAKADEAVVVAPISWNLLFGPGGTRFLSLRADHPADSIVSVHCAGPSCPFFVRAEYAATAGRTNLAPLLQNRQLAPGAVLEVWVEQGNKTGAVLRVTVRAHASPRVRKLCIPEVSLAPQPCH
jgi:hypothetical protein